MGLEDNTKYAVITGATISKNGLDTIGSAIAKALAPKNYHLLIAARDEARLAALRAQLISLGARGVDIVATDLHSTRGVDDIVRVAHTYPREQLTFFDNVGDFLEDDTIVALSAESRHRKEYLTLDNGIHLTNALNPARYVKTSSSAEVTPYPGGNWYREMKHAAAQFALSRQENGGFARVAQPSNVVGEGTRARNIPDGNALDALYVGRWISSLPSTPSFSSFIVPQYERDTRRKPRDTDVWRRDILEHDLPFGKGVNAVCDAYERLTAKRYAPLVEILLTRG